MNAWLGIPKLDRMINGLNWGELVVIGGQSDMGKTALALDIARHAALHARDKASVAIFSLDDPESLIAKRLLAAESRVELHRVLSGKLLSAKRLRRLAEAADLLAESDIVIDHAPGMSLQVLRKKCSQLKKQQYPLDIVIIDPIQAMSDWQDAICNKYRLYELIKGLHNLAEDMDAALIVVSELSEVMAGRPRLTDFPEWGPIELLKFDNVEADVLPVEGYPMREFVSRVLLLYREEEGFTTDGECLKTTLSIEKSVGGQVLTVHLQFHPGFASFHYQSIVRSC